MTEKQDHLIFVGNASNGARAADDDTQSISADAKLAKDGACESKKQYYWYCDVIKLLIYYQREWKSQERRLRSRVRNCRSSQREALQAHSANPNRTCVHLDSPIPSSVLQDIRSVRWNRGIEAWFGSYIPPERVGVTKRFRLWTTMNTCRFVTSDGTEGSK